MKSCQNRFSRRALFRLYHLCNEHDNMYHSIHLANADEFRMNIYVDFGKDDFRKYVDFGKNDGSS